MLQNYLIVAIRNLAKNKLYTFINVLGLSIGISCFTILYLMVRHDLSSDQFHEKSERIFRVIQDTEKDGIGEHSASVPFPMGQQLEKDFPTRIHKSVRIFNWQMPIVSVTSEGKRYNEKKFYFADSSFFEVFDYPLLYGDKKTALLEPNSVIISHHVAQKYFKDQNPVGKTILFQGDLALKITGVFSPHMPISHFYFDFIAPISSLYQSEIGKYMNSWWWNPCWTYIVLDETKSKNDIISFLNSVKFKDSHFKDDSNSSFTKEISFGLQNVEDIYLYSQRDNELSANGDERYVYVFIGIALLVLITASINFMNLATARASLRIKEIGVRKVLGAEREQLVIQFLFESVLLSILSILFGFMAIEVILPHINALAGGGLNYFYVNNYDAEICIVISGILVGFLSGIYPAYFLSGLSPSHIFGKAIKLGKDNKQFRRSLVTIQFAISTFLIIGTFTNVLQLEFMKNSKLGFSKNKILVLPIAHTRIRSDYEKFKYNLLKNSSIKEVTAMEDILGKSRKIHGYLPEGGECMDYKLFSSMLVRPGFLKTFDIKILAGRAFDEDLELAVQNNFGDIIYQSDDTTAVIINRAMVDYMGWGTPEEAIGKRLASRKGNEKVIAVVENFHFSSLHQEVSPFVLDLPSDMIKAFYTNYVAIKLSSTDLKASLKDVKHSWKKFAKGQPIEYFFLDDKLDKIYTKEEKMGEISAYFTLIAILIASMGLFALASFVVEQRKKEIGIRKAIGAETFSIVILLNKTFLILVSQGILVGWIVAYFGLKVWLNTFAYHIELSPEIFIISAIIVLIDTFFIVSIHTIRAAFANPIHAIQKE